MAPDRYYPGWDEQYRRGCATGGLVHNRPYHSLGLVAIYCDLVPGSQDRSSEHKRLAQLPYEQGYALGSKPGFGSLPNHHRPAIMDAPLGRDGCDAVVPVERGRWSFKSGAVVQYGSQPGGGIFNCPTAGRQCDGAAICCSLLRHPSDGDFAGNQHPDGLCNCLLDCWPGLLRVCGSPTPFVDLRMGSLMPAGRFGDDDQGHFLSLRFAFPGLVVHLYFAPGRVAIHCQIRSPGNTGGWVDERWGVGS